ncbi:MAG: C2 family cysteine protease [Pseudomonadota bacterium]
MRHAELSITALLILSACRGDGYSPSLTMIRIGSVEVEEPPLVPDALYTPGINIAPEDYEYEADAKWMPVSLDLTNMQDLEDPAPLEKHAAYDYTAGTGALLDEEADESAMNFDDVEQGAIGDCYFPAALAASLYIDQDQVIRTGLVREVEDKHGMVTHFSVRFYDAWGVYQDIAVDPDLVRKNGKVTYARSTDSRSGAEEWWPSLVEKAYAEWHGGYEKIGEGGWVGDVMQAITGSNATYRPMQYMSDATLGRSIQDNIAKHRPVAAGTYGEDSGVDYSGKGVWAHHAYTLLGAEEREGTWYVTLRNPWGCCEPGDTGGGDGVFELDMATFKELYQGVTLGGGYTVDHTAPEAIDDLAVVEDAQGLWLQFTASGDDGDDGLAAKYDLRISQESISSGNFYQAQQIEVGGPAMPGDTERIELGELAEGTWYFALKVEDESGNISALSNVATVTVGGQPDTTPAIAFEMIQDWEGDSSAWDMSGLWHLTELDYTSASHSVWFGDEHSWSYDTGAAVSGSLTSPKLDTNGIASPFCMWDQVLDVEATTSRDIAVLEVSTEAGGFANWTAAWEKDGTGYDWSWGDADLGAYGDQIIKLRFRFDSVDATNNDALGWMIDDLYCMDY